MRKISVTTKFGQYTVSVGSGILDSLSKRMPALAGNARKLIFLLTSPEIWALWGRARAGFACSPGTDRALSAPGGASQAHEPGGTADHRDDQSGRDRSSLLIAFGGGVTGDVGGFVSAIYMRGIDYIQVPTTLLSQVDSSVGGKTGVNLQTGKNLVGCFYPPQAVVADIELLRTLPQRELRAGIYESIKAGLIRDASLFRFIESHREALDQGDPASLEKMVAASIRIKAEVVGQDERELGVRMILNFGHTLGHAIEAASGYRALLHGEAIAWGMIAALHISRQRKLVTAEAARRIEALIRYFQASAFALGQLQTAVAGSIRRQEEPGRGAPLRPAAGSGQCSGGRGRDRRRGAGGDRVDSPSLRKQSVTVAAPGAQPEGTGDEASAAAAVRSMFDQIAPRYDLLNHVLSCNIDRVWWRRAARSFRQVLARPDAQILDLCCGTGDMTLALLRRRPKNGRPVLAADFAHQMLLRGAAKFVPRGAIALEADALHLPLPAGSIDLLTTAFGFRNLANYRAGLEEFYRTLKPGGELGILDFSEPGGLMGKLYAFYFRRVLPAVGSLISGVSGPYRYLPSSVRRFPAPTELLQTMQSVGFEQVSWTPYSFGIAGLYRGVKR